MLQVVLNDADEPHSSSNVRIVVRIDDSIEFVGINGWQVVENPASDSVVIAKQYCAGWSYGSDFIGSVRSQCSLSDLADLNTGSISVFNLTSRSLESTTCW